MLATPQAALCLPFRLRLHILSSYQGHKKRHYGRSGNQFDAARRIIGADVT